MSKPALFNPDTPMSERLRAFWRWLAAGNCRIKDGPHLTALRPNRMQRRLFQAMLDQSLQGLPIRIVVLKGRKPGVSTFIEALAYFLAQHTPLFSARVVAHTQESTRDIFAIARRIAENDPAGVIPSRPPSGGHLVFPHDSSLTLRTAGGAFVLSGATTDFAHLSELAKWSGGADAVKAQLASITQSVPFHPQTVIVIESTANMVDTSGQFRAYWDAAARGQGPYRAFFTPWFEDDRHVADARDLGALDDEESDLVARHALKPEQLAWRRRKIRGDFAGDVRYFRQEHPSTPEEAFQNPSGLIYPMLSLTRHGWGQARDDSRGEALDLMERGYRLYRSFDWGDADALVCLWVAHKPGAPAFTINIRSCPETWRELTGYAWTASGRPMDHDDHTCDALRYAVSYFQMTGHVHVYRELYERETAARGRSVLDVARQVLARDAGETISGSVGDRSRPGTILLLSQQGLHIEPYRAPSTAHEWGEKVDGIMRLQAIMVATVPLHYPPPPVPLSERLRQMRRARPLRAGICADEWVAAMDEEHDGVADPFYGAFA